MTHCVFVHHYFAVLLQKPWEKVKVMLTLISHEQRVGKTSAFTKLGEDVLGNNLFLSVPDARLIVDKFDVLKHNRLLILINEIDDASVKKHEAKLKSLITEKEQTIEKKGIDAMTFDDYSNVVATTNHGIKVDREDGRTAVFECKKQKTEYYNGQYTELMNYPNFGDIMLTHYLTYELKYTDVYNHIPQTFVRKQMQYDSATIAYKYAVDVALEKFKGKRVLSAEVYQDFNHHCWHIGVSTQYKATESNFRRQVCSGTGITFARTIKNNKKVYVLDFP